MHSDGILSALEWPKELIRLPQCQTGVIAQARTTGCYASGEQISEGDTPVADECVMQSKGTPVIEDMILKAGPITSMSPGDNAAPNGTFTASTLFFVPSRDSIVRQQKIS